MNLADELLEDLEAVMVRAVEIFIEMAREDPDMPFDTGALSLGVDLVDGPANLFAVLESTTRAGVLEFDYGTYWDNREPHLGWWNKVTAQETWDKAVNQSMDEMGF